MTSHFTHIIVTFYIIWFWSCRGIEGIASTCSSLPLSFVDRSKHNNKRLSSSSSAFASILRFFTTLSHFEKEEEESKYKLWVDIEYDEQIGSSDDEDDLLDDNLEEADDFYSRETRYSRWWKKDDHSTSVSNVNNEDGISNDVEEHPMRTDEWLIKIQLSPFCILPRSLKKEGALFTHTNRNTSSEERARRKEQRMKFAKNGYVILIDDGDNSQRDDSSSTNNVDKQRIRNIGRWQMDATGISWTMQVQTPKCNKQEEDNTALRSTCLHYHADIHLSKFQSKPRMFKGTITRDRFFDHDDVNESDLIGNESRIGGKKVWFRPVIASFTAEGIGEDTLALNYKERGFGLTNNGH